jgi:predicted nicotinamide N-methyase
MDSFCGGCEASPRHHEENMSNQTASGGSESLIALSSDAKYERIDAFRALIHRDSRFVWTNLPNESGASRPCQILMRQKGVAAEELQDESDAQLRAVLETDSIPQYVWPAASPLQQWIVAHSDVFAGKTVLELGCGTGIVGFTVAPYAKLVVLTDCSAVALAMVLESLTRNRLHNCRVAALSWGREDQMKHIKEVCRIAAFDVVIGSDVFYFSSALRSGLATARSAFAPVLSSDAVFLCASVARSERMESDLDEVPIHEGFELSDFVTEGPFRLYRWKLATA